MPIRLTDLIERVTPEVETKVRRVRDQMQDTVRDALRAECRLWFRTPEESKQKRRGAQVPVEVTAGYPVSLEYISFPDDFERIMLLVRYRALLKQARSGASGLLRLRDELLLLPEPEKWTSVSASDLQSVADWSAALLKVLDQHDPLKKVLSVSEDFLGVYEYEVREFADEHTVNRARIQLYWGVIGLFSDWFGCSVDDLTVVVLTHELAHAYTQLGADIESRRWAAPSFAKAETALKEGLAQYYTDRVLRKLEEHHGNDALKVFLDMLPGQPEAYRAHQPWIDTSSAEAIRLALLEIRRWNEGKLADFNRRLADAQKRIAPTAGGN